MIFLSYIGSHLFEIISILVFISLIVLIFRQKSSTVLAFEEITEQINKRNQENLIEFKKVLATQKPPNITVQPTLKTKKSSEKYKFEFKKCPFDDHVCKKNKCLAYYIEDDKAKCAALGDIILDFKK